MGDNVASTAGQAHGPQRPGEGPMTNAIFAISLFLGVAAVALVAFTLLWIVLGKVDV
jgi:hypothetical protein